MTNPDWPTIKGGGILLSIIGQNRAGRQHPFYLLASAVEIVGVRLTG